MHRRDKHICKRDCEVKEVLRCHEYEAYATVLCLNCIHLTKQDNFVERQPEEEIQPESLWKQFRTWARNGFN